MLKKILNWFKPAEENYYGSIELIAQNVNFGNFKTVHPDPAYFTAAELQQLKVVLAGQLNGVYASIDRFNLIGRELRLKGLVEDAEPWYKEARKQKVRAKVLSNLQKKVKHTLATRG